MKTTLDIPDAVFRRAKAHAAARGVSLRAFVTEAVEHQLRSTQGRRGGQPAWKTLSGGLRRLRRETARLRRIVDEEFETIEPEDAG